MPRPRELDQSPARITWPVVTTVAGLISVAAAPFLSRPIMARAATPAAAPAISFSAPGADKTLLRKLRDASLLVAAADKKTHDAQDLYAAARADYRRLIGALYAAGHYAPVIHILIDGREAASIAPLDAPTRIGQISVTIAPGPLFHFGRTRIAPRAPSSKPPKDFAPGRPALSGAIAGAVNDAVDAWRRAGHAKARLSAEDVVAHNRRAQLDAAVTLAPGPAVRFGRLVISGKSAVRRARIADIAGFPAGKPFDPAAEQRVADRLRKTGAFSSVALTESKTLGPDGTMDVTAAVVDQKPRRLGFGAEVSSSAGIALTGFWLHRNLLGGAERFRIDAAINGIAARDRKLGYSLSVRLDRPATFNADTTAYVMAKAERQNTKDFRSDLFSLGTGLTRNFSSHLTGRAGILLESSRVRDALGTRHYNDLAFPLQLTIDWRDKALDAHRGYYLDTTAKPFLGFGGTGSGLRLTADARAYQPLGKRFVLAERLQLGTIVGAGIASIPRDYLFYSGGGGTVRGQPYQSLGVTAIGPGIESGGRSFAGISGEVRARLVGNFGIVGFYDAGYVSAGPFFGGGGGWQAGAGLGLRYDTGLGPIRLDLGLPVGGHTGHGLQLYVGIGQAF